MPKNTPKAPNPNRVVVTHHSNGKIATKTPFVNDKKHGMETRYDCAGAKAREITWNKGKKHGVLTWWYTSPTRIKWKEMWKDGKRHGATTEWDNTNNKRSEITFRAGKKHGFKTKWHWNGSKAQESMWVRGKKHGLTSEWWDDGKKWREATYRDGNPQAENTWWKLSNDIKRSDVIWLYDNKGESNIWSIKWSDEGYIKEIDTPTKLPVSHPKSNFTKSPHNTPSP